MKRLLLACCVATQIQGETLFGPGTINIATNEAIVINTVGGGLPLYLYVDDVMMSQYRDQVPANERYAIAGPHSLTLKDKLFITFQRLQGSSIRTSLAAKYPGEPAGTNVIAVPNGKTVQLFAPIGSIHVFVHPQDSTNVYELTFNPPLDSTHPAVTGPATIEVVADRWDDWEGGLVSYYLTDEVLQLPPSGFSAVPGLSLEVNIERSYNLTHWIPIGSFNTEAEANAYYRLRMLK